MQTYTLATPFSGGSLSNPVTVSSLQLTTVNFSSTPALAPMGTGTLTVVLTDLVTGFQETFSYCDASVLTLWGAMGDAVATAVFDKLIADQKLPAGTLAAAAVITTPTTTATTATTAP